MIPLTPISRARNATPARSLPRTDERTKMKGGGADEKDGRDLRGQRPGKILGMADHGRDRHAVEGLEEARDRSIDGLCASRRGGRAGGHRRLLLKASILRGRLFS